MREVVLVSAMATVGKRTVKQEIDGLGISGCRCALLSDRVSGVWHGPRMWEEIRSPRAVSILRDEESERRLAAISRCRARIVFNAHPEVHLLAFSDSGRALLAERGVQVVDGGIHFRTGPELCNSWNEIADEHHGPAITQHAAECEADVWQAVARAFGSTYERYEQGEFLSLSAVLKTLPPLQLGEK